MKTYHEWQSLSLFETDSRNEKKNNIGGLDPHNNEERKIHKHADLITLPVFGAESPYIVDAWSQSE